MRCIVLQDSLHTIMTVGLTCDMLGLTCDMLGLTCDMFYQVEGVLVRVISHMNEKCVAVCCCVLQCVAGCCSVLQCLVLQCLGPRHPTYE